MSASEQKGAAPTPPPPSAVIATVRKMRAAQKRYFKTRNMADLDEARRLGKIVDEAIAEQPALSFNERRG